ncbi:MAG: NADH-quinone oxidoreductase subunit NuoF [Verrucomicrobiota bacterium]
MTIPAELERQIDEIITHYPTKRAPVLWLCHLLQEHFGFLGQEQVEWIAAKLDLQPINVWEVVTFYPMFTQKPLGKFHIKVCRTLSCQLAGSRELLKKLEDCGHTVSTVECLAACGTAPVMMVNDEHFDNVTPEKLDHVLAELRTGSLAKQPIAKPLPAHPMEKRVLLANITKPGFTGSLADYEKEGGYQALAKALMMKPEEIVNEVKNSEIRGRGGAGFPCGLKWSFLAKNTGKPTYLVCNADESEPGTFKDRQLINYDPHQLLEGILISCYATGAKVAYIYIRGEMPHGAKVLINAIEEARVKGYVGKGVEIYVHRGAGAYICGEETGLIESLEGKRAYPRIKPPFPAIVGLFGSPTVVNNVETLSNIPHIVKNGAAWFKAMGVPGSTGTRLVCVSGPVKRPGYYEFEMGKLTMRQLIEDVCGGVTNGQKIKGVIPGGSSMPVLPANNLDVPLDFESLRKAGTMAGSGGIIVLTEDVSIVDATLNVSQFYAHESCGQCTPCREGTLWMEKMLHRIKDGHGRPEDVDLLFEVADNIDGKTICPLGEAAAWPVKAFLKNYRSEFEEACKNGGKNGH